MGKKCTIITNVTRDLTKQYFSKLDVTDLELNEVNNMISLWQSENNSEDYPNIKELHNFIWNKRKNSATSFIHTINNVKSLYYVLNDLIYNDKGENITNKLSDFNRNKILLKNAIINKLATIVTYNGKKYFVDKNNNIFNNLFLQDNSLDNLTEEDKQNISTLALETQNILSEEQEILKNAPRDEQGRLLAPNGNPTNLTEKQYIQVRTKAFKEWFGDWENNPAESSKVVDKNGEPLVVYRATEINDDGTIKSRYKAYYFTPSKDYAEQYAKQEDVPIHSFFLKANSINDIGNGLKPIIRSDNQKVAKRGLFEMPWSKEDVIIILEGKEAAYSSGEYLIPNLNQIKSATDNIGTFSKDSDDIRYNRTNKKELSDLLEFLKSKLFELYHQSSEFWERKELSKIVHKFKNELYLNKFIILSDKEFEYNANISLQLLKDYLKAINLDKVVEIIQNKDSFGNITSTRIRINEDNLNDVIEGHNVFVKGEAKSYREAKAFLDFLSQRLGVLYKFISKEVAKAYLKDKYNQSINAFNYNGVSYFIEELNFNYNIQSEEMLHPFIASMKQNNPEVFLDLLEDARQHFPKLHLEILNNYPENEIEEELVTQALARTFVLEKELNPEPWTKQMLNKFYNWITSIFTNEPTLKLENYTLKDIARLINSDAEIKYKKLERLLRLNIELNKEINISYVSKAELNGKLASTSKDNVIKIANDVTVEDFFTHIKGDSNNPISQLKLKVFEELSKLGYTEEVLGELIKTPEDIKDFLFQHELSHVNNKDRENYFEPGEVESKSINYLTDKKINIELRATLDALNYLKTLKNQDNTTSDMEEQFEELEKIQNELSTDKVINVKMDTNRNRLSQVFNSQTLYRRTQFIYNLFSAHIESLRQEYIKILNKELNSLDFFKKEDKKKAKQILDKLKKLQDEENKIANTINIIGFNTIISRIKEDIESYTKLSTEDKIKFNLKSKHFATRTTEDNRNQISEYIGTEYQKILDNFDALIEETIPTLEKQFKIRITKDLNTLSNQAESISKYEDNNEDNDNAEETRELGKESYLIKNRFQDSRQTVSKRIKEILSKIPLLNINSEGKASVVYDDIFQPVYLTETEVYNALVNDLSSMLDADDFVVLDEQGNYSFPALERLESKYPYIPLIIKKLKQDPSLISLFYSEFRRDKNLAVTIIQDEKGKIVPKHLNEDLIIQSQLNKIIKNYENGVILHEYSIYDTNSKINLDNVEKLLDLAYSIRRTYADSTNTSNIIDDLYTLLRSLGFEINKNNLHKIINKEGNLDSILNDASQILNGAKNIENDNLIDSYTTAYSNIANIIGVVDETYSDPTYSLKNKDGEIKSFPTFVAPNFLSTLINKLTHKVDRIRQAFIDSEFKSSGWFFNSKTGNWKMFWMHLIENHPEVRSKFIKRDVNYIFGTDYMQWTSDQIVQAFVSHYFDEMIVDNNQFQYGNYHTPIYADSPVTSFIRMIRFTGSGWENQILDRYVDVVKQEIWRINKVIERRNRQLKGEKVYTITNWDDVVRGGKLVKKGGSEFKFFPELNQVKVGDERTFLEVCQEFINNKDVNGLNTFIKNTMKNVILDPYSAEFIEENKHLMDSILKDKGIVGELGQYSTTEEALKEYYWNQVYATTQIIQMTTTDIAYYKDATDFQKRFKEVYAAGRKLNTNSKYGRKEERVLILSDQIVTSRTFKSIQDIAEQHYKQGIISELDKDFILTQFKDINATDAQAYRHLESVRAVLDMVGEWSEDLQKAFDNFENNKWDMSDFMVILQTIKPYLYTTVKVQDGENTYRVPHQNKNSEFVLLAMYSILAASLNNSPLLKGLNKFMRNNAIDVVQFESAVKVGGQGIIQLNYSEERFRKLQEKGLTINNITIDLSSYKKMKEHLDELLSNNSIEEKEYYKVIDSLQLSENEVIEVLETYTKMQDNEGKLVDNPNVIKTYSYEDYIIQQPTPEHLLDTEALFGSQFRNIIKSDIPENATFEINGKPYTKKELIALYEELQVANLDDCFEKVYNIFNNIEELQKELLKQVRSNVRYNKNLIDALEIVTDANGNKTFKLPPYHPILYSQMQSLLHSIIRNNIVKQKIKGGNCILTSCYGLTDKLKLKTKQVDGQTCIEYAECYLPLYSKKMFEPFMITKQDSEGNEYQEFDIELMPTNLRELIGYRIPTEDKYSILPLRIKGFLPQQNGSAIMLPADITTIAGSDYDVDKMFLMLYEFTVNKKKCKIVKQAFEEYSNTELGDLNDLEDLHNLLNSNKEFYDWYKRNIDKYSIIEKQEYDTSKNTEQNSVQKRNNQIIDISTAVLRHPSTAIKMITPGNFNKVKKIDRISRILKDKELLRAFILKHNTTKTKVAPILLESSLEELDSFIKEFASTKHALGLDTFIYNHKQNTTGLGLVGIYAVNTSMQNKFQNSGMKIHAGYTFTINGRIIQNLDKVYNDFNERISANCAQLQAASVDGVKDPSLATLNQNLSTASIAGMLVRAGLDLNEIGLLFNQPIIDELFKQYNALPNKVIKKTIEKMMGILKKYDQNINENMFSNFNSFDFNTEFLINNMVSKLDKNYNFKGLLISDEDIVFEEKHTITPEYVEFLKNQLMILQLFNKITTVNNTLNKINRVSRADTSKGNIGTLVSQVHNQIRQLKLLNRELNSPECPIQGVTDFLTNDVITDLMQEPKRTRISTLMSSKMPLLQAMYSYTYDFIDTLLSKYFVQYSSEVNDHLNIIENASIFGYLSDTLLNSFYKGLLIFKLSQTELFGKDYLAKRKAYLVDYPNKFKQLKESNDELGKKLNSLGIIKKMEVIDGKIILPGSSRLFGSLKESFIRDLESLLYDNDPKTKEVVRDLLMYSYYRDGLFFSPETFSMLFSPIYLSAFPELEKVFKNNTISNLGTYTKLFMRNNFQYMNLAFMPYNKSTNDPNSNPIVKSENGLKYIKSEFTINKATGEHYTYYKSTSTAGQMTGNYGDELWEYVGEDSVGGVKCRVYKNITNETFGDFRTLMFADNISVEDLKNNYLKVLELLQNQKNNLSSNNSFEDLENSSLPVDITETVELPYEVNDTFEMDEYIPTEALEFNLGSIDLSSDMDMLGEAFAFMLDDSNFKVSAADLQAMEEINGDFFDSLIDDQNILNELLGKPC